MGDYMVPYHELLAERKADFNFVPRSESSRYSKWRTTAKILGDAAKSPRIAEFLSRDTIEFCVRYTFSGINCVLMYTIFDPGKSVATPLPAWLKVRNSDSREDQTLQLQRFSSSFSQQ